MNNFFIAQTFGKSSNYTDIPNHLFKEHNVKKGLRNEDGTGVRVGLTRVSDVVGYEIQDGKKVNVPGKLFYRGIEIGDLVKGKGNARYGFEETTFLLLFGYLPSKKELNEFSGILRHFYPLPDEFLEKNLLRSPSRNLMNSLQQSILSLYNYDEDPDNVDPYQTLLKGISILAKLPSMAAYAFQSKIHYYDRESLIIHYPKEEYSIAENILYMLRRDGTFTEQEADLLDVMLMIHADHGGGNNSTFTNVVISSTGTDIYSSITASIGSLKGPKHGGANIRCSEMISAIEKEIGLKATDAQIKQVIKRILDKEFYDNTGLVYGLGHAVYTVSDPRADLLKTCCEKLAKQKKREDEYEFLTRLPKKLSPETEKLSQTMWTSTADSLIICYRYRKICTRRSSSAHVWQAGWRTISRIRCMMERSCVRRSNTLVKQHLTRRERKDSIWLNCMMEALSW